MNEEQETKPVQIREERILNWTLGVALVAVILFLAVWVVQLIGTRVP